MSRLDFSARRGGLFVPLLFFFFAALGCQPRVGDDCVRNQDCSGETQRLCDTSQPGGYCTLANCTPTSCPESESICVAFNSSRSTAPGCENPGRASPYVKNFCMLICSGDEDCRAGYACIDVGVENPWGAAVIQRDPGTTKICAFPASGGPIDPGRSTDVCTGDASGAEGGAGGESSAF